MRYQENDKDSIILSPLLPVKLAQAELPSIPPNQSSSIELPSIMMTQTEQVSLPEIANTDSSGVGVVELPQLNTIQSGDTLVPEGLEPPQVDIGNAAAGLADGPTDSRSKGADGPVASAQIPQPPSNPEQMIKALKATLYRDQYESGLTPHDTRVGSLLT
jgi:hypothetical protein